MWRPSLRSRAKEAYRDEACRILRGFLVAQAAAVPPQQPPPIPTATAIADFDGAVWGEGYLSFTAGDAVLPRLAPQGVAADGWAYGSVLGAEGAPGWYPPRFVA